MVFVIGFRTHSCRPYTRWTEYLAPQIRPFRDRLSSIFRLGIIIGISGPLADRPYFGFCCSFEKPSKREVQVLLFFIPFIVFTLLCSLTPSRKSGPESHCIPFPLLMGASYLKIVCYVTKRRLRLCKRIRHWVIKAHLKMGNNVKNEARPSRRLAKPWHCICQNAKEYNLSAAL